MGYWDGGHSVGGWGIAMMTVTMLLFWALVIGGLIVLLRGGLPRSGSWTRSSDWPRSGTDSQQPPAGPSGSAQQILAERFARGEIDEAEYARRRQVLDDDRLSTDRTS